MHRYLVLIGFVIIIGLVSCATILKTTADIVNFINEVDRQVNKYNDLGYVPPKWFEEYLYYRDKALKEWSQYKDELLSMIRDYLHGLVLKGKEGEGADILQPDGVKIKALARRSISHDDYLTYFER